MPLDTVALTVSALRVQPDAKQITLGAGTTWGLLNDDEQIGTDENGRPVTQRDRTVFIAAGSLSGVVDGATITVGTVGYTVRSKPMPRENGDIWAVMVTKVEP
jgi:hypothetical protein